MNTAPQNCCPIDFPIGFVLFCIVRFKMKKLVSVCLGIGVALLCASVQAGTVGGITIDYVGNNPYPGFESTGGSGRIINNEWTVVKDFNALGDVPIILSSNPSSGVDTLSVHETVNNNTGIDWTDFHLLFGRIDNNTALTIDFLNVSLITGFSSFTAGTGALDLFGGIVPDGESFTLSFDLRATSQPGSFDLFGIHESPSIAAVPEPATLALVGLGLAGLGYKRRRKAG